MMTYTPRIGGYGLQNISHILNRKTAMGVYKTWARPWPLPWPTVWPTLWPNQWPTPNFVILPAIIKKKNQLRAHGTSIRVP